MSEEVITTETPDEGGSPQKAFTPEDVERIVRDRLARERKKFEGFDDLKAKAEEYDRMKAEQMTEAEKTAKRLAELEAEIARRDEAIKAAERRELASAAALDVAKELGVNPDAALKWAAKLDGDDADTLKASARDLFGSFAAAAPPSPPEDIDKGALADDDMSDPFIAALRA